MSLILYITQEGNAIHQLNDLYWQDKRLKLGEALYLYMLAVHPEFQGRFIAKRIIKETLAHAKNKGYQFSFTAATNKTSHRILGSVGFIDCCELSYQAFEYEGETVFSSITEDSGTIMMEKYF